jgi:predicted rRNA methylase
VINKVDDPLTAKIVQTTLLRSMKQARYDVENTGHFALNFDSYTHFTSPIRRYSDLLVHRQIRRLLDNPDLQDTDEKFLQVDKTAEQTSSTERRAEKATREAVQWLKCEFMSHKIGDNLFGVISSVTEFGVFVELEKFYIDGLVHITSLGQDYYRYEADKRQLVGESSGKSYQSGDRLEVQVARVDMEQGRIDFALTDIKNEKFSRAKRGKPSAHGDKKGGSGKPKKSSYDKSKSTMNSNNSSQQAIVQQMRELGLPVHSVDKRELVRRCGGDQNQGIALEAKPKQDGGDKELESFIRKLEGKKTPLLLILDQVQDPHNFGACLRTADAAGADAVVVASPMTAVVQKVASGAAETMPIFRVTNLARAMENLQQLGIWMIGTSDKAKHSIYQEALTGAVAIVMGAEGRGMRSLTEKKCDSLVNIPMAGSVVSSLNVSVATGVCLYEVVRQRAG